MAGLQHTRVVIDREEKRQQGGADPSWVDDLEGTPLKERQDGFSSVIISLKPICCPVLNSPTFRVVILYCNSRNKF